MPGVRENMEMKLREGRVGFFLGLGLSILAFFYGMGVRFRFIGYRSGLVLARRLSCKVVSVGNIMAGGTGKTPVTLHVAKYFALRDRKVVVLSRGYGGTEKKYGVVSDGNQVLLSPAEAGDEPVLMAKKFISEGVVVPVVVGPDRVKAGERIIEEFSPEIIILDDGFQHLRLRRNLDIVLVDFSRPGSTRLLPRGLLREPPSALARADILLFKGEGAPLAPPPGEGGRVQPAFTFGYRPVGVRTLSESGEEGKLDLASLKGMKIFLFAGIADPVSFKKTVKGLGATVAGSRFFSDHQSLSAADLEGVRAGASEAGADMILTTEKDAVRIEGADMDVSGIHALVIEVSFEEEKEFFAAVDGTLSL